MEKVLDIIDSIAYAKGLDINKVQDAVKEALIETAIESTRQQFENDNYLFDAQIDRDKKELKLFQKIEVIADDDPRLDELENLNIYTPITDAKEENSEIEVGDFLTYELEFEDLGRNGAYILNQKLEYKLQRFVENNLITKYESKIGTIVSGTVIKVDSQNNTFIEIGEIKGILNMKNRIKGEKFYVGDILKSIIKGVHIDKNYGMIIELSRTSPKFLEELLKLEVPEIADGHIMIESIARIPGQRAKIALHSNNPRIDAIGSVVGVRGIRINSVSKELNGENIDCVDYFPIKEKLISKSLNPAIVNRVELVDDSNAKVYISKDEKSKAIGKNGFNIRLASMLTKCTIELVEENSINSSQNSSNNSQNIEKTEPVESLEALFK